MHIPDFIRKAKSGDILATKYGNLLMVARVEIEEKSVCIYHYFDWDKDTGFQMNEWLEGFYGPRYIESENFYRPATDEEKTFFLDKLKEFGYELREMYGNMVPQLTADGYKKFYRTRGEIQPDKDGVFNRHEVNELLHKAASELLVIARTELVKQGYVIEKKAFHDAVEKVEPEVMKEVSENINLENFIHNLSERYPEVSFAKLTRIAKAAYDYGKAEALKDLPR